MTRLVLLFLALGSLAVFGDDEITVSPKGTFKIIQHGEFRNSVYNVTESLRFAKGSEVVLEYGIFWAADFYISPDDHWILRIQKTGSGDNTGYLYKVEPFRVWRMEEHLPELGFDFLQHQPGGVMGGLYHCGIDFVSWDLKTSSLHFSIHGSGEQSGTGVHRSLTYKLFENRIESP